MSNFNKNARDGRVSKLKTGEIYNCGLFDTAFTQRSYVIKRAKSVKGSLTGMVVKPVLKLGIMTKASSFYNLICKSQADESSGFISSDPSLVKGLDETTNIGSFTLDTINDMVKGISPTTTVVDKLKQDLLETNPQSEVILRNIVNALPAEILSSTNILLSNQGITDLDAINKYYVTNSGRIVKLYDILDAARKLGLSYDSTSDVISNIIQGDQPSFEGVDLVKGQQKVIENLIIGNSTSLVDGSNKEVVKLGAYYQGLSWIPKNVGRPFTVGKAIPLPTKELLEAIADNSVVELAMLDEEKAQRCCQFLYFVLVDRWLGSLPDKLHTLATSSKRKEFVTEFTTWWTGFIQGDSQSSKYMRALYTSLRMTAQASDTFAFITDERERRAMLIVKAIKTQIIQSSQKLMNENRGNLTKLQLKAIRQLESESLQELRNKIPLWNICEITYGELPERVKSDIASSISSVNKSALVRAKALTLRAWCAMEYACYVKHCNESVSEIAAFKYTPVLYL